MGGALPRPWSQRELIVRGTCNLDYYVALMIDRLRRLFQPDPEPVRVPHFRDISEEDLQFMRARSEFPELLDRTVAVGRAKLGFFPAHNNRAIEYPWLLFELSQPPVPATVLDVGAGLNPIPFCLAELGSKVTTIDAHPNVRTLESQPVWNEWGFLDYSQFDPRISSVHTRYEEFEPGTTFDAIYSASVIEHVPAEVRRIWVKRFADQLNSGGRLLLTLDLKPGSDDLWNLSEEVQVDDPELHGSQTDLCNELRGEGFEITCNRTFGNVKDSRIDTGLVAASLRRASPTG